MSDDKTAEVAFAPTLAGTLSSTPNTLAAAASTPSGASSGLPIGEGLLGGRWEIRGLIGAGGMGAVYRAHDRELDETVALKVLRADLLGPDGLDRFRREVRLARKVTHKNVARVFDLGEHEGIRFFTMECVEGESLRGLLMQEGALALDRVVEIGSAICRGLAAAHEVGVVHRDLKPDNVLVGKDGRIAITDFGIAASMDAASDANKSTAFLGTPAYMAPEQVDRASPIGPLADVYAVGALLFELATGQPPWRGETVLAVAAARLVQPPPDPRALLPKLPAAFADLVTKAMARRPEDRFASASALGDALAAIPTDAAPATLPPPAPPSLRRDAAKRIAVLPLENGARPEDAYIAEGLTEDLIDAISMARGLRVTARGLVARFADKRGLDEREIGEQLGVDVVASGALRRLPDGRLRVTLRLVSAHDGIQIWAKRFDRLESEILRVNEEAAASIASALSVDAPDAERDLSDPEAVALYLRARAASRAVWLEGSRRAVDLFRDALIKAPEHPLLLAGYAQVLARLTFFSGAHLTEARAAAERAIERAPALGESHVAMASVELQSSNLERALRSAKRAVAVAPMLAEAHLFAGRILSETGPLAAALKALHAAYDLDPTDHQTMRELARAYALAGQWDRADDYVQRSLKTGSNDERIGMLIVAVRFAMWRRDEAAVRSIRDQLAAMDPTTTGFGTTPVFIAKSLTELIDHRRSPEPDQITLVAGTTPGNARRVLFFLQIGAEGAAFLGDRDKTLARLEVADRADLHDWTWLERCPLFDDLREDARYRAVEARVRARAETASRAWTA
ncbi:MAG TPA: serine/threonine-protein kinase [Polyangiaceae bacterium]|nr:serine/threonine-protein kinase [Polyangiaceae bacterium]